MPAVAEVQFKAQGSQQVVTAFNSVGSAAQTSATKVQQNSTAMKSMGQGMKSTVSGIGQAATAFATLSLSVVATWRAYRDLGDAQIAVDKANLRVKKTTEAIRKGEAEVAKLKKESAKGGLEQVAATHKIQLMEQKLAADRKSGKKTALELRVEEDAINLARKEGVPSSKKLMDAENKLALQKEQLGVQTDVAKEAQERFNDTQQNFYLSIAPLAISTVGTLATAFSGLKGMLTGGGGLVAGLGPIGLILGGISVAILAFKTNFLGLRDAVGGVIDWIKARFGVWKDTIEKVFNLIREGNWGAAFDMIKLAAIKFWIDLKKSVPFFGTVETIVKAIKEGKWSVAFDAIKTAALAWWADMKKAVPFLADLEKFLDDLAKGKWDEAFKKIAEAAKTAFDKTIGIGIKWLLGENWQLGLEAKMLEVENEAKQRGTSVPIEIAREVNVSIIKVTGVDVAKWFKEHPLTTEVLPISLGGISLSIEDPKFQAGLAKGAEVILGALGVALSAAAKVLDPYLAAVVKALNFNTAITAAKDTLVNAGQAIWIWIFNGIKGGFQIQDWSKLFDGFPTAVNEAWAKNLPQVQAAIVKNWNDSIGKKVLEFLGVKFNATPVLDPNTPQIITKGVESGGPYNAPLGANTKTADKDVGAFKNRVERGKYIAQLALEKKKAENSLSQFLNKVNSSTATIKIATQYLGSPLSRQIIAGNLHQHGYQGTVKRPTMFIAGEGGRPEDVTVRPRGSVQRGGGGGGSGFYGTVNVYVDGVLRPARYDMGARK